MQEIEQHQRRLSTALLRIGAAFERLAEPPPAAQVLAQAEQAHDMAAAVEIARLERLVQEAEARSAALSTQLSESEMRLEEVVLELSAELEARDATLIHLRETQTAAEAPAGDDPRLAEFAAEIIRLRGEAEAAAANTAMLEKVILTQADQIESRDAELEALRAAAAEAPQSAETEAVIADLTARLEEAAAGQAAVEARLTAQIDSLSEELETLLTAPQADPAALKALQAELATLSEALAGAEALAAETGPRLAALSEDNTALTAQVAELAAAEAALREALSTAEAEAAETDPRLEDLAAENAGLVARLAEMAEAETALREGLSQQLEALSLERDTLLSAPQADPAEVEALKLQLSEAGAELERLRQALAEVPVAADPDELLDVALTENSELTARLAEMAEAHKAATATLEQVILSLTTQLEARTAALREAEAQPQPDPAEAARLQQLIADRDAHAAELSARIEILSTRHRETTANFEDRIAALNAQVDGQGDEAARLRSVNVQLRDALRALREGMAAGVVDAAQINGAMAAELEALTSARAFEVAELDALLSALDPLLMAPATSPVTEASHA